MSDFFEIAKVMVKGIETRLMECERNGGHIKPRKIGYTITIGIDPLKDRISMFCVHCRTMYERSFNPEEVEEFCRFYAFLREYRID